MIGHFDSPLREKSVISRQEIIDSVAMSLPVGRGRIKKSNLATFTIYEFPGR
jgi:hypothetical protein